MPKSLIAAYPSTAGAARRAAERSAAQRDEAPGDGAPGGVTFPVVSSVARSDTVHGQCGRRATAKTDWPKGGRTSDSAALVTGRTSRSYSLTIGPSFGISLNTQVAR